MSFIPALPSDSYTAKLLCILCILCSFVQREYFAVFIEVDAEAARYLFVPDVFVPSRRIANGFLGKKAIRRPWPARCPSA